MISKIIRAVLWLVEGAVVGFGAIMPGVSGATLCVAFGMYRPIITTLSHPRGNIGRYAARLSIFLLGAAGSFIGLSGLADYLMRLCGNAVICAFIGFIIGTLPTLWRDAGERGRGRRSYAAAALGFVIMLIVLSLLSGRGGFSMAPSPVGYLVCGALWGLSFIVPGLSSSTLIIFLGLYQPMLEGISRVDPTVVLPLALGIAGSVLLLSRAINAAYSRYYAAISHAIFGVVVATTIMIIPSAPDALSLLTIPAGAAVSFLLTRLCDRLARGD